MTTAELNKRLASRPGVYPGWVDARALYEDGGVVYLSSISEPPERIGVVHIYIWGASAMGQPLRARRAAAELMQTHSLDRLMCEIDADNHLALRIAERGGMKRIGIMRQRKRESGEKRDVVLMDALLPDLMTGRT